MGAKIGKENRFFALVLIGLFIVGGIIIVNFFSFSNVENVILQQFKENQLASTVRVASQMELKVLQLQDELNTLSKLPNIETLSSDKCKKSANFLHQRVSPTLNTLVRVNQRGDVTQCSSPIVSHFEGLNLRNKDYFQVPKQTREPFVSSISTLGSSEQIIVSAPIYPATAFKGNPAAFSGILFTIIEVDNLYSDFIYPIVNPDTTFFLLANLNTNQSILKSDVLDESVKIVKTFPNLERQFSANTHIQGLGNTILTSSDFIFGSEKWRLIVVTPIQNVGKELLLVQRRNLFSLGFILLIIIAVFFFLISIYRQKEVAETQLEKVSLSLEEMGINIDTETERYAQSDIILEPKKVYLVKEDEDNQAHELFISTLNRGYAGLGFLKDNPQAFKKKYNLEKTSFIWLTKTPSADIPAETNIENIEKLMSEFMTKSQKSAMLVEKMDYLIAENTFEKIVQWIHHIKDLALEKQAIIILSINPSVIDASKMVALESQAIDIFGKYLKSNVELETKEMEILKFINQLNTQNKLISFKDITKNFNITKPTTRAKIGKLAALNLVSTEKKGRSKSLKITAAGRRIIK